MGKNKRSAWGLVALGIIGGAAAGILPVEHQTLGVLRLIATVVAVVGISMLAQLKGRSWAWGLLGFLCFVGLPVVLLLPPKPPKL